MHLRLSQILVLGALLFASACDTGAGRIDEACRSNADCEPLELCATGLCEGGLGVCELRPTECPDSDDPVCGCDDITYQNRCFATMAGIRLARTGPCIDP